MPKGNTSFKTRVNAAVDSLHTSTEFGFLPVRSRSLFSPVLRGDDYQWVKIMDSDGLLVGARQILNGEGRAPDNECELLVGVIIQSEDETSQTKPNPIGKAALAHIPNGVWIDIGGEGRRRLDRCFVLMLLPKGAASTKQKKFATAKRNVANAADTMPDCNVIEVSRGINADDLAVEIKNAIRRYFKGRGRPKQG